MDVCSWRAQTGGFGVSSISVITSWPAQFTTNWSSGVVLTSKLTIVSKPEILSFFESFRDWTVRVYFMKECSFWQHAFWSRAWVELRFRSSFEIIQKARRVPKITNELMQNLYLVKYSNSAVTLDLDLRIKGQEVGGSFWACCVFFLLLRQRFTQSTDLWVLV